MSLQALMSRITQRRSHGSSKAERALADARADAALRQRKQGDQSKQHGWGMQTGGGLDGGGF